MLPKKHRLTTEQFPSHTQKSTGYTSAVATLKVYPDSESKRVGVVISKKVARLSVKRSALKRRAYRVFAERLPSLPNGVYILILRKGAAELSKCDFNDALERLLLEVYTLER